MAKVIEKLTKVQESKLDEYRDKWLKIGLCTKRANRELAETYVKEAYKAVGLSYPTNFIWTQGPYEGALAASSVKEDQVGSQVWNQVRNQVEDQVWNQVRSQVEDQVWNQVRNQVEDQVRNQVGSQVWNQVRNQVEDQVWNQVEDQVFFGSQESSWLAFYEFFSELGVKEVEKLRPLMKLATECGWCWFFTNTVVLSEKPLFIHRDFEFKLHCETGPALAYADGLVLYRIHGKEVTLEELKTSKINNEVKAWLT